MKRFLMLIGVALVAGAMYVAAAPGGLRATGPSAKQFAALKKQVATLSKLTKRLNSDVIGTNVLIIHCLMHQLVGVSQKGDPAGTFGYSFTPSAGAAAGSTTALDLAPTASATYLVAAFNPDQACQALVGQAGLQHLSGLAHG